MVKRCLAKSLLLNGFQRRSLLITLAAARRRTQDDRLFQRSHSLGILLFVDAVGDIQNLPRNMPKEDAPYTISGVGWSKIVRMWARSLSVKIQ